MTELPGDETEAEVAGHGKRAYEVEQPTDDAQDPEAEVAGHGYRHGATEQPGDDPEAEVAGHAFKAKATEQPAGDEDAQDAGDAESIIKGARFHVRSGEFNINLQSY